MRRTSRTSLKMLAPITGCTLRGGPWRSSMFGGDGEIDRGYESSSDR